MENLAARHDFLSLLIEGHALAGAGCGIGHDGGDGMLIARLDRCVRLFARAQAFEPIAHVGIRQWIATHICRSGGGGSRVTERERL